jgi:hypothetical protein
MRNMENTRKKSAPAVKAHARQPTVRRPVHDPSPDDIRQSLSKLDRKVLLTERQVAAAGDFKPQTMKQWRLYHPGKGPIPTYVNGSVRYSVENVLRWLDSFSSTPDAAA